MSRVSDTKAGVAAVLLISVLALAGCGTAAAPRPGPAVTLALSAPGDGARMSAATATVVGRVSPARARVEVLGHTVAVAHDGNFSTRVRLAVGTNLIDVIAAAPRSTGAVSALRVVRFLLVTVPQLSGESPAHAAAALKALGLAAKTTNSANLFSFLIPTSAQVCSSAPSPGTRVDPGTTVTLRVSKLCGF